MDAALEQMLERHGRAAPVEVQAIREGLRSGSCALEANTLIPRSTGLLTTYRRRAEWLTRFESDHARALRSDTERFCDRLAIAGDVECRMWTFAFGRGRLLLLVENAQTGELLGVLHPMGSFKLSAEEWAALWGTDPAEERAWRRTLAKMTGRPAPGDEPP